MFSTGESDLNPLIPRQAAPPLKVSLAGGGTFDLVGEKPKLFTLIVFYRGLHCMQCNNYLVELDKTLPEFEERGVSAIAVSCDGAERGARTQGDWGLSNLRIGYGLQLAEARRWGLFLTEGRPRASGLSEPPICCEPGLFLIRPDGTLFFSAVQNMPFARPRFADLVEGLDFMFERGYFITKECPAKGEIVSLADFVPSPED